MTDQNDAQNEGGQQFDADFVRKAEDDLNHLAMANIALAGLVNAITENHWLMGVILGEYSRKHGFDLGEWVNGIAEPKN